MQVNRIRMAQQYTSISKLQKMPTTLEIPTSHSQDRLKVQMKRIYRDRITMYHKKFENDKQTPLNLLQEFQINVSIRHIYLFKPFSYALEEMFLNLFYERGPIFLNFLWIWVNWWFYRCLDYNFKVCIWSTSMCNFKIKGPKVMRSKTCDGFHSWVNFLCKEWFVLRIVISTDHYKYCIN